MDLMQNKVERGMKASMAHDLERGNRIELGREFNIPTPANDTVYTVLELHRLGSQH